MQTMMQNQLEQQNRRGGIKFGQWIVGVRADAITITVSGLDTSADAIKITCRLISRLPVEAKSLVVDVILPSA